MVKKKKKGERDKERKKERTKERKKEKTVSMCDTYTDSSEMHTFSVPLMQTLIKEELHSQCGDAPDAFNFFPTSNSQLASRSHCFIGPS